MNATLKTGTLLKSSNSSLICVYLRNLWLKKSEIRIPKSEI
jgi:hypothetical protein